MTPAELAELHARCFSTPRPFTTAEFASLLDARGVFLCLRPGGFALGRAIAGETELLTLAVDPGARRQGVGRALMAAFESESRARKAEVAFLEVAEDNTSARSLYIDLGYRETGRRRGYYRHPDGHAVDAVIMQKAL